MTSFEPTAATFESTAAVAAFRAAIVKRDWVGAAAVADVLDGYLTAGGDLPAQWHRADHPRAPEYRPEGLTRRLAARLVTVTDTVGGDGSVTVDRADVQEAIASWFDFDAPAGNGDLTVRASLDQLQERLNAGLDTRRCEAFLGIKIRSALDA